MDRNVLVVVLVAIIASYGMAFRPNQSPRTFVSSSSMSMKWDGTRPPCPALPWLEQRMDATWGRGKFRTEVWDSDVNPVNSWWEIFHPSEEEIEAANAGYNFKDPEAYFKEKGIDPEKAMEAGSKFQNEEFEKYLKEKNERKPVTEEEFRIMFEDFFALKTKVFEAAIRLSDNKKQAAKGQPSLDAEDTGIQWKNDAIE